MCVLLLPVLLSSRSKNDLLSVNFDVELSDCMQEVKYLHNMEMGIPDKAASIYDEKETFRMYSSNLQLVVGAARCKTARVALPMRAVQIAAR